jgi:hypothetical protein
MAVALVDGSVSIRRQLSRLVTMDRVIIATV